MPEASWGGTCVGPLLGPGWKHSGGPRLQHVKCCPQRRGSQVQGARRALVDVGACIQEALPGPCSGEGGESCRVPLGCGMGGRRSATVAWAKVEHGVLKQRGTEGWQVVGGGGLWGGIAGAGGMCFGKSSAQGGSEGRGQPADGSNSGCATRWGQGWLVDWLGGRGGEMQPGGAGVPYWAWSRCCCLWALEVSQHHAVGIASS